jgi:hypothetical protein
MPIKYEWTVELIRDYRDGVHDVIQSDFYDSYKQAQLHANLPTDDVNEYRQIGLVRQVFDSVDTLLNTSWAYVAERQLPNEFSDYRGCVTTKVPQKYKKEFDSANNLG